MKPVELAEALTEAKAPAHGIPIGGKPASLIYGVVVSIQAGPPSTLTLTLAASAISVVGIRYLRSYIPVVGDTVMLAQVGSDFVVIDALATRAGPYNPYMAEATQSVAMADTNNVDTYITLNTKTFDPSTNFDTTTHLYTCPMKGTYLVGGNVNSPAVTAGDRPLGAFKNGSLFVYIGRHASPTASGNMRPSGSVLIPCNAGDTLGLTISTPGTTAGSIQGGIGYFALFSTAAP